MTKIRAVNTNLGVLGLDLHSNSPKPLNFFGAQSSLGGAQFSFGGHKQSFGGHGPGMSPSGAGPDAIHEKAAKKAEDELCLVYLPTRVYGNLARRN